MKGCQKDRAPNFISQGSQGLTWLQKQNHKDQEPDTEASKLTALGRISAPCAQATAKPADTEGRVTEGWLFPSISMWSADRGW